MKDVKCKRCSRLFEKKDIYTIQQFQYRKDPTYLWTIDFFKQRGIGEWDSFCEDCIMYYGKASADSWQV